MPDSLYVIDATAASLVELPAVTAQIPTLVTYTFHGGIAAVGDVQHLFTNFAQEQAVLYVNGWFDSSANTSFDYNQLDLLINGTSFVSQGSPTAFKTNTFGGTSFPLWTASDMSSPPIVPAYGSVTSSVTHIAQTVGLMTVNICLVPASQVPLLGGL